VPIDTGGSVHDSSRCRPPPVTTRTTPRIVALRPIHGPPYGQLRRNLRGVGVIWSRVVVRALKPAAGILLAAISAACTAHPAASDQRPYSGAKGGDGVLRVSLPGEPRTLNPNIGRDELAMLVGQNVFNKLVGLGADGTLIPELADRWTAGPDGTSYTFHLRRDVRWHDGTPFTAADVHATFARLPAESSNRDVADHLADANVLDPHTIEIRLRQPWAAFIPMLATFATAILPAHVYGTDRWEGHPANAAPVGTGPFRFVSWRRGASITLEKNTAYFGPGPYMDTLEYVFSATPEEAAQRLLSGQVDATLGRPPANRLRELMAASHLRVVTAPGDGRQYLAFNLRRLPFSDLRARRSVALAVDRRRIVEDVFGGLATPAIGMYTPTVSWAYNPAARAPARDVAAARRLAEASGAAGRPLTLLHPVQADRVAVEVVRQLGAAGLRVRPTPSQDVFADAAAGTFDLVLLGGSHGPDPDALLTRFGTNGAMQLMGYSSAPLDAALEAGRRTRDPEARARIYFAAQEILAGDVPFVPLIESVRVTVYNARIRGHFNDDALGLVPDYSFSLTRLRVPAP